MKKILIFVIVIVTVISTVLLLNYSKPQAEIEQLVKQGYAPAQGSKEELYQDIFVSLLQPYVDKATDSFYSKYLSYLPGSAPYFNDVLSVERVKEENQPRRFEFLVKLEVLPYIGPHNSVGRDIITFRINASGEVTLEKFEHVESFPIAPDYQDIIKKWPPS